MALVTSVVRRIVIGTAILSNLLIVFAAQAQTGSFVPVRRPTSTTTATNIEKTTTIDAETSWVFRMKQDVVLNSPIVRLGDIIVPLDPNLPGWLRLSRSSVGLLPLDGTTMKVDQERLAKLIVRAEATPQHIQWVGSDTASIRYVKTENESQIENAVQTNNTAYLDQSVSSENHSSLRQTSYHARTESAVPAAPNPPLSPEFADRIIRWIEQAIERDDRELLKRYQLTIDWHQPAMAGLETARGIEQARFVSPVEAGKCALYVKSRGLDAPVEATLIAELEENPVAVVPVSNLRVGIRIRSSDLRLQYIAPEEWEDTFCVDALELIGTETKSYLRQNQPIRQGSVGKPTLIRRGDLLEVRVINGAISVTTNAKAQADGAESDLIEIETLDPRKRLIARVVQSGLVEIVSRAPRTR